MFKLDLSVLREHDFRINQLRLFHTSKFRGINFMKNKKVCADKGDLTGEKSIITEYLIEDNEITYTSYLIFTVLSVLSFLTMVVLFFVSMGLVSKIVPLVLSFLFFILSKESYTSFVMGNMGIEMSESFYDFKIKNKYNL